MSNSMKGMSLITLEEFSPEQVQALLSQSIELKRKKRARIFPRSLADRNFCMIFQRPSCRTRTAFAIAAADEGAQAHAMSPQEIRFGSGESIKDIARVLGRMFDGIAIRAYDTPLIEEVAEHAGVPVWNALTEQHHPTQALADFMTLQENGIALSGAKMAYVGEGKANVVTSLMVAAAKLGVELRVVTPKGHHPEPSLVDRLLGWRHNDQGQDRRHVRYARRAAGRRRGLCRHVGADGRELGHPGDGARLPRLPDQPRGDGDDRESARALPALHAGAAQPATEFARKYPEAIEATDEVFDGPLSRAIDQAENRMHTIKALMVSTV